MRPGESGRDSIETNRVSDMKGSSPGVNPAAVLLSLSSTLKGEAKVSELFAKGQDGQIELNNEMLTICRKGVLAIDDQGPHHSDRRIPIGNHNSGPVQGSRA